MYIILVHLIEGNGLIFCQVMVYCDWLSPLYAASLSLIVYEPLRLTCLEHSAKGNCFLQLILENTSPLPLAIKDPLLTAEIDLDKLHGSLPEVRHNVSLTSCVCVSCIGYLPSRQLLTAVERYWYSSNNISLTIFLIN